jgi:hypothetical protein
VLIVGWFGGLCAFRLRFQWVCLVGFFLSFFGLFFWLSNLVLSLVHCRCTKGRLTLLIKPIYYLSKKKIISGDQCRC